MYGLGLLMILRNCSYFRKVFTRIFFVFIGIKGIIYGEPGTPLMGLIESLSKQSLGVTISHVVSFGSVDHLLNPQRSETTS